MVVNNHPDRKFFMPAEGSRGIGLIEVMAALFVIVIAVTSLLVLYSHSLASMSLMGDLLIAKQEARETLESIFTARNTQQVTYDMIQNVSTVPGIFLDGYQSLKEPNPTGGGGDGLVGTSDDGPIKTLVLPGQDDLVGTADDEIRVLTNFQRWINFEPVLYADSTVNPDVRKVTVTIQYTTPLGNQQTYEVASYVSRFR